MPLEGTCEGQMACSTCHVILPSEWFAKLPPAVEDEEDAVLHVQIAVEDHGPGVADTERELIFERFARGGGAGRRTGSDGAGLGLALVDEHVRMHGGRVWVEDRLDGESGARFVIELMAMELDE